MAKWNLDLFTPNKLIEYEVDKLSKRQLQTIRKFLKGVLARIEQTIQKGINIPSLFEYKGVILTLIKELTDYEQRIKESEYKERQQELKKWNEMLKKE